MHQHAHHGHHHHATASSRIGLAFVLNASFTIIEFIGGLLTNSTAIMADAVHDLGDTLAIGSAWWLARMSAREADTTFTYGYRRFSLFGAFVNGIVLTLGAAWVLYESLPRLLDPVMPETGGMMGLALLGIAVNGFAAWRLMGGKSLNERVLNWHLLEDVLGWVAVLIVSIVLTFVDLPVLDPLLAIGFMVFIAVNVLRNLVVTSKLFFQGVPEREMTSRINQALRTLPEVAGVHHEHLWSLDGEHHVYTAHIELAQLLDASSQHDLKQRIAACLAPFDLTHTTIELELPEEYCRDSRT